MKFSERKGLTPVSKVIQTDGMSNDLRNSIWNVLDLMILEGKQLRYGLEPTKRIKTLGVMLWLDYFKEPVDSCPEDSKYIYMAIRDYFFSCEWYEVYDLLEFVLNHHNDDQANIAMNSILERELSGYRFVGGVVTDITDEQEIQALELALSDQDFPSVKLHLQRALELLSDRDNPDYRNSIKESVSAVESFAQTITGKPKTSLGQALKVLEQSGKIHPALKKSFSSLYGYTSNADGIRHAMLDEPNLSVADAKFFLLSCTSFINYVKSKI